MTTNTRLTYAEISTLTDEEIFSRRNATARRNEEILQVEMRRDAYEEHLASLDQANPFEAAEAANPFA